MATTNSFPALLNDAGVPIRDGTLDMRMLSSLESSVKCHAAQIQHGGGDGECHYISEQ